MGGALWVWPNVGYGCDGVLMGSALWVWPNGWFTNVGVVNFWPVTSKCVVKCMFCYWYWSVGVVRMNGVGVRVWCVIPPWHGVGYKNDIHTASATD